MTNTCPGSIERVAFIVPAAEDSVSGPRNSVTLLADALNQYTDLNAVVYSTRCETDFAFNGITVQALDVKARRNALSDVDLVVFSGVWLPENVRIARWLRKQSIPYLVSPRSSLMRGQFRRSPHKKWPFLLLGGYHYLRHAAAIHFLSEDEKSASYARYFNQRSVVVSNALPTGVFAQRPSLTDSKVFGFLGRYVIDHKGLDILFEALALVADEMRHLGWKMKLRGTDNRGELGTITQLREQYRLTDIVELGGAAHGDDKFAFLNQVAVFVHTSRYEGQPQAVMEAMSCGCAILVSPGANMSSAIELGRAGLNRPLNAQAVAKAMQTMMHNPEQVYDFRKHALSHAQTYYTPQAVAKQFAEGLSESLITSSKG